MCWAFTGIHIFVFYDLSARTRKEEASGVAAQQRKEAGKVVKRLQRQYYMRRCDLKGSH